MLERKLLIQDFEIVDRVEEFELLEDSSTTYDIDSQVKELDMYLPMAERLI